MSYIDNPRYLELADQIENHSRAMAYLLDELIKTFPLDPGDEWTVADHRPRPATEINLFRSVFKANPNRLTKEDYQQLRRERPEVLGLKPSE